MTAPRAVLPGTTYLLDRRTTRRYFLLRPDADGTMQQILLYTLAVTAKEFGIKVHAVVGMSSHPHEVVSDPLGVLPVFLQEYRRLLANATKVHRGWPEEVFNKSGNSKVELLTPDVLIDKIAYCIANPVAACAVPEAGLWPGVNVRPEDIGVKVFLIRRPDAYYDPNNPRWPEEIELPILMPQLLLDTYGLEEAQRLIRERVEQLEQEARAKARAEGCGFGTAASAVQTKFTRRAKSYEHFGVLNPTFAAGNNREVAVEAIQKKRLFEADYRDCRNRWRHGERDLLWPAGTWAMVIHHGARCHPNHDPADRYPRPPP